MKRNAGQGLNGRHSIGSCNRVSKEGQATWRGKFGARAGSGVSNKKIGLRRGAHGGSRRRDRAPGKRLETAS